MAHYCGCVLDTLHPEVFNKNPGRRTYKYFHMANFHVPKIRNHRPSSCSGVARISEKWENVDIFGENVSDEQKGSWTRSALHIRAIYPSPKFLNGLRKFHDQTLPKCGGGASAAVTTPLLSDTSLSVFLHRPLVNKRGLDMKARDAEIGLLFLSVEVAYSSHSQFI